MTALTTLSKISKSVNRRILRLWNCEWVGREVVMMIVFHRKTSLSSHLIELVIRDSSFERSRIDHDHFNGGRTVGKKTGIGYKWNKYFKTRKCYGTKGSGLSAADVKMEIPVLVRSLKSNILSSIRFQMDKTFCGNKRIWRQGYKHTYSLFSISYLYHIPTRRG